MEYVLAALLLTAPADTEDPVPPPELVYALRLPIHNLAIAWQILDPREVRYTMQDLNACTADLNLLRRRNRDLHDAPFAQDCERFPERTTVNEFLSFNRTYRQSLDMRQTPHTLWTTRAVLQETDYLYEVWDTLRDARCEYYYVSVRRQALLKLRCMIGERDYYAGQLPAYVPMWHFTSVQK